MDSHSQPMRLYFIWLLVVHLSGPSLAEGLPPVFTGRDGAEMRLIPAGSYLMGSSPEYGYADERPRHRGEIGNFYLDKMEVSNLMYGRFRPSHRYGEGMDSHPTCFVSWSDAVEYASWAGKRLPTEAEWEYAASGGVGHRFPWGNAWNPDALNWNNPDRKNRPPSPKPVGAYENGASPFGILNLSGNAMEWVADLYGPYGSSPDGNQITDGRRSVRGGCWLTGLPSLLTCQAREAKYPSQRCDLIGFRCAIDADQAYPETADRK